MKHAEEAGLVGGRQLQYHPHIHYVVPGGALSAQDGAWHASSLAFFLPVRQVLELPRFGGQF
ncbi:MAG: transposase [Chromatiales bacterium]